MTPDGQPVLQKPPSASTRLALWHAELDVARSSAWLASLLMRRLGAARSRLAALRDWLAGLPRHMRRAWMRQWGRRGIGALPIAALLTVLAGGQAQAATITVDPGGSGCTLSAAIINSNSDNQSGSPNCTAGSGLDIIDFANANTSYALNTNYGAALPTITGAITIQGNGHTTFDAEGAFRVFRVFSGFLEIHNATITGGSSADGGGIYANGSQLILSNTTISGNSAHYDGGGIYGFSSRLTVSNTTITGNSASSGFGGGIGAWDSTTSLTTSTVSGNSAGTVGGGVYSRGRLTIRDTTISENSAAGSGGGLRLSGTTVGLINATISSNSASNRGGGIDSNATLTVVHSTVTGNRANNGGGIYGSGSSISAIEIQSSIVANQVAGANCSGSNIASGGYNIENGTSCAFTMIGDQQNVSSAALDLGALALNVPGTTETHSIGAGSAALDQIPQGSNSCGTTITTDQRGATRPEPAGGRCDVGAYEREFVPTPTPTPVAPTAARVTQFKAAADPTGRIRIAWETASEIDVVGFRVQRAPEGSSTWEDLGAMVPARGKATGRTRYASVDNPGVGSFTYRLLIVNADRPPSAHGPVAAMVRALRAFLPVAIVR